MTDLISNALTSLSAGNVTVLYDLPAVASTNAAPLDQPPDAPNAVRTSTQLRGLPIPSPKVTPVPVAASSSKAKTGVAGKKTNNSTTSRMISVVEIIKRTAAESAKAAKGKQKAGEADQAGDEASVQRVHQYNRIGCLEDLGYSTLENSGAEEDQVIEEWLGTGKTKRPKKTHTPYMIVVLHTKPVTPLSKSDDWTHQLPPKTRKKRPAEASNDDGQAVAEGKRPVRKRRRKDKPSKKGD